MKRNRLKQIFIVLIAISLLFLSACGGGGNDKKSNEGSGKDHQNVLKVSVDGMYIDYLNEIKSDFEKEHRVLVEITEKDMFETLEALALDGPAGIAPDVMIAPYDRVGNLGQQGHLAEISLPEDGRYDDTDKQQVTINGKIYGAPFVIETLVLYYNKNLIDDAPTTFEELEALAKDDRFAFESEKGKSTAFLANWVDFYMTYGLISGYGGYVFGNDGTDTTDIGLNTEEAIEGIEYAVKWYQEIWPQGMLDVSTASNFIDTQFTSAKAAAIIGGPWSAATYKEAGIDFGVSKIPTLPNGEEYQPFAGGKAWVISNYSKNKELAAEWINYITNEVQQQKLYEMLNEVPANQGTREIVASGDDDLARAVIEQYHSAVPMPNIPEMAEVWTGAENLMFDAASGKKTAEQSANDAVQIIKENIEQKY